MTATPSSLADASRDAVLRTFIARIAALVESTTDERPILDVGATLLAELVRRDDWLPDEFALPDASRYRQYLLHCDSRERFSVVSFVWGPGQSTPVHDHTVWGLVGVLRGAEREERYARAADGSFSRVGSPALLTPGTVGAVSPRVGDVHRVSNAYDDRTSISIHVYGANIGAVERSTYDAAGTPKRFVSGYANRSLPNLWDRSGAP
jgi:predicted metal-dependent enzyme (double-stranded beta helix superfamily)